MRGVQFHRIQICLVGELRTRPFIALLTNQTSIESTKRSICTRGRLSQLWTVAPVPPSLSFGARCPC